MYKTWDPAKEFKRVQNFITNSLKLASHLGKYTQHLSNYKLIYFNPSWIPDKWLRCGSQESRNPQSAQTSFEQTPFNACTHTHTQWVYPYMFPLQNTSVIACRGASVNYSLTIKSNLGYALPKQALIIFVLLRNTKLKHKQTFDWGFFWQPRKSFQFLYTEKEIWFTRL